jgi:hypothetical protein
MTAAALVTVATPAGRVTLTPLAPVLLAVALMTSTGCSGPVRRAVAGGVTLEGQPLDEAVIVFVPLDVATGKTGAMVVAGRYEIAKDVGLPPGRYRVEITDDPPIDQSMRSDQARPRFRRQLPIAYSVTSPLTVDVTADGPTEFDFQLTLRPAVTR